MVIITVALIMPLGVYSENGGMYRDPFSPVLPPIEQIGDNSALIEKFTTPVKEEIPVQLPPLVVQGLLYGSKIPQAIIDGEVYKAGDELRNINGKVSRVEKNSVFILYQGKTHEVKVKKREGK